MRTLAAILVGCIASTSCFAQEAEAPKTIAGFLKPGTHVGIRAFDETGSIRVSIYSKPDFEIALDARRLDLAALAAKYEKVARSRDRTLEQFTASLQSKRGDLPSGTELGEPKMSLFVDRREGLYTVVHVGDDYILVSFGDEQTKRRAFATRFVSTISWHDGLRFNTSVRQVTGAAGRNR